MSKIPPDFESLLANQVQEGRRQPSSPQPVVINVAAGGIVTLVLSGTAHTTIAPAKQ